jgi:GNAT superfamily N-acetyltransferase
LHGAVALSGILPYLAGCFVGVDDDENIVGYYTLAATSIRLRALSEEFVKRLPRYPVVQAMLIGRLAVAASHQGKQVGRALMADAVTRIDQLGIEAFALIVDAKDERAKKFYEMNGLMPLPDEERRLWLPMETALHALRS